MLTSATTTKLARKGMLPRSLCPLTTRKGFTYGDRHGLQDDAPPHRARCNPRRVLFDAEECDREGFCRRCGSVPKAYERHYPRPRCGNGGYGLPDRGSARHDTAVLAQPTERR